MPQSQIPNPSHKLLAEWRRWAHMLGDMSPNKDKNNNVPDVFLTQSTAAVTVIESRVTTQNMTHKTEMYMALAL